MRRGLLPGEYFGSSAHEAPSSSDDFDDDAAEDAELQAFERELTEAAGGDTYNEENEEDRNREHFIRMFKEHEALQQQETASTPEPSKIAKALERLHQVVKAEGRVTWSSTSRHASLLRQETLTMQLDAALQRIQPPGDLFYAAVWRAAARPPWPVVTSQPTSLSLSTWIGAVERNYKVLCFALVVLYQNEGKMTNRVALLGDWKHDEMRQLLAIILEGACPAAVKLGAPDSVHRVSAIPKDTQSTLMWRYVGTTLADIALVTAMSQT